MRVAVAGGTGRVGRHVVEIGRERGHDMVVCARSTGVDLTTGEGLAARLSGVDATVDTSGTVTQDRAESAAFFAGVTEHLLAAGAVAGVGHHVVLSIVGIDDVDTGYYAGKRRQEQVAANGALPWSLLRSTQFHEFTEQALDFQRLGPISLVPRMLTNRSPPARSPRR